MRLLELLDALKSLHVLAELFAQILRESLAGWLHGISRVLFTL